MSAAAAEVSRAAAPVQQPAAAAQPAAMAPEQPAVPTSAAPVRPAMGATPQGGSFVGTISLKDALANMPKHQKVALEAPTRLEEEKLHRFWDEMVAKALDKPETHELGELLRDKMVRMEGDDQIVITTINSHFVNQFKEHQVRVLEWLRARTGVRSLTCRIEVRQMEKEKVIYSAPDRYGAMAKVNPVIFQLRKLLPDLDL